MSSAVTVNNVFKRYGRVEALQGVSLSVEPGELFGIIGPDGAGKTSLFRILTTLLLADEGTATVCGLDTAKDYKAIRERVGYMPGRFSLYQDLTVEENLNFFATVFHTTIEENYDLVRDIYRQIEPFRNRRAGALSGGMKQKLALSCALIHKPDVLFLDEPTTGVDPVSRKEFWEMLRRLREQGITIIASTPIIDEACQCDRIAFINEGRIRGIDTPDRILKQFADILCPAGLMHEKADNCESYVIEVDGLTKRFGSFTAVDHISFKVRQGEIFGFLGANGAGKTTAFNVITGVYQPTNGAVWFDGGKIIENHPQGKMKKQYKGQCDGLFTETLSPSPDKITRSGMARTFQNIRLWKTQTVFDNVLIAKHCRSTSSVFSAAFRLNRKEEAAQRAQVEELLEIVGLSDVKNELATSLPYGKQRRLEIARALAAEPKLLLLDEPAAGMNPQETEELTAFIGEIREKFKITILLIEHHMNLVMGISDRIYVLDFGKLIAHGTPAEIQKNQRVIDAYLGVADDA